VSDSKRRTHCADHSLAPCFGPSPAFSVPRLLCPSLPGPSSLVETYGTPIPLYRRTRDPRPKANIVPSHCTNTDRLRYYLVFVALNLLYSVLWNVFGVETRGRTLEELSEVFDANFPPKAALAKTTMLRREGGGLAGLDA
jgi:hypothetical protein